MTTPVALVSGHAWIQGRWIESIEDLAVHSVLGETRAKLDLDLRFGPDRIPRADRFTQIGGLVLSRALAGLEPMDPEDVALVTASTLASAHTNERFELRRRQGRPPEPRSFPYTAPNASGGEWSIAAAVRGPILTLVGGPEVSLVALERASSWLVRKRCRRALVVAAECPPERADLVAPQGVVPVECAAALIIETLEGHRAAPRLQVCYTEAFLPYKDSLSPLLSVEALAQVTLVAKTGGVIARWAEAGAGLKAVIEVPKCPF